MKRTTRIIFSVIAWFVCHFTLHIILAAGGMDQLDMKTVGGISVVNTCMAASVYFFTGLKNRDAHNDFAHKQIVHSSKKKWGNKWYWPLNEKWFQIGWAFIAAIALFVIYSPPNQSSVQTNPVNRNNGLKGKTVEQIVKDMADHVSKDLPKTLNRELALVGVFADGRKINYQLMAVNYIDGLATPGLITRAVDSTKRAAISRMCTGDMAPILKEGASIIYHYYDSEGLYLKDLTIETTYNDCKKAGFIR